MNALEPSVIELTIRLIIALKFPLIIIGAGLATTAIVESKYRKWF